MHLRAEMPAARIAARGLMELRIARKVACLSGIAGSPATSDDAGSGRCWFSAYEALTLTELAVGGPMVGEAPPGISDAGVFHRAGRKVERVDDPAIDVAPIPNVTLREYGPDTLAALVLTGVNRVLEPVTAAVLAALHDIRRQADSPQLLVTVAHCMIQEVFAAQPILFLNGIQASRVQRALTAVADMVTRPGPDEGDAGFARVEHGWPQPTYGKRPRNLDITYQLWDALVAGGSDLTAADHTDLAVYDRQGRLRSEDAGPYLRALPAAGFEQTDALAADDHNVLRERLVSVLRHASEAVFIGGARGAQHCSVRIVDEPQTPPYTEVMVPRQRQIEQLLGRVADWLSPLVPQRPPTPGSALALPRLDVATWADRDLLHRRAAVLAHYYSLRAAGWIDGMLALDRRRNRDECATRCTDLVTAAAALLSPDDPLRDQVSAYALGYQQQYSATFGHGAPGYAKLLATLTRMHERIQPGRPGRAELWETLQLVLRELNTVRRAAFFGLHTTPSAALVTEDVDRWWGIAHELRNTLIDDADELRYLDHEYATFLASPGSDDARVLDGLKQLREVIESRELAASRSGRSLNIRKTYASYLRGLSIALENGLEPASHERWAREAVEIAARLEAHPSNVTLLEQRTGTADPERPVSYDGSALKLLVTLADGWVCAVRSGALPPDEQARAAERAQRAVARMCDYYRRADDSAATAERLFRTSPVGSLRAAMVAAVERRWTTRP